MSSAAYYREHRTRPEVKERRKVSDAKPERVERRRKACRKYAQANHDKVRVAKAECRANGRAYAREAKNVPCADCGGRFPVVCMDFDRREGEDKHPRLTHKENGYKRMPISMTALATQSLKAFKAEALKCDVVCANCHRIRTDRRKREKV